MKKLDSSVVVYSLAIALLLTIGGCTPVAFRSLNETATLADLLQARYECYQEVAAREVNVSGSVATSKVVPSCSALNACLAARGYIRDDAQGNLIVPASAVISCTY